MQISALFRNSVALIFGKNCVKSLKINKNVKNSSLKGSKESFIGKKAVLRDSHGQNI